MCEIEFTAVNVWEPMLLTDPPRLCSGLYGDDYKTQRALLKEIAQAYEIFV